MLESKILLLLGSTAIEACSVLECSVLVTRFLFFTPLGVNELANVTTSYWEETNWRSMSNLFLVDFETYIK